MSLACIDQFISPILFRIQITNQPSWNLFNILASSNRQDLINVAKTKKEEVYIITLAFIAVGMGTLFRSFFEVSGIMSYGYISRDIPFWLIFISLIYLYKNIKTEKVK